MIRTRNLVPGIYYNESRDFQILGRTFEILFNYIKTNIDLMEGLPFSRNCDIHMLPLLAQSLGFTNKRNYSKDELSALCSSFIRLLRYKGTKKSIQEAVNLMLHANGINEVANIKVGDEEDPHCVIIYVPIELKDVTILEDIFEYILPCGFNYRFIYTGKPNEYQGAYIGNSDRYAFGRYNATGNLSNIGLIANPNNIESPTMPESGNNIQQTKLSMISTGTITNPDLYQPSEESEVV